MFRMILRKIGLFIFLLYSVCAYTNTTNNIFHVSDKSPENFLGLIKSQQILVDVYYENVFLGVTKATISKNSLRFENPESVLYMLKDKVKNTERLRHALIKKLPKNTNRLCDMIRRSDCNILFPKVISIIYDPNNFKVILFINPKFQRKPPLNNLEFLPSSSSGFSYLNQIYGVSNNITGSQGYNYYNLNSNNILAYKNTRLNLSTAYANNLSDITLTPINIDTDVSGNTTACIYSNQAATPGGYVITATSGTGGVGSFLTTDGSNNLSYTATWDDGSGASSLTSGTQLTGQTGADETLIDCGGVPNATFAVNFVAADMQGVPQGTYTDTVTLLISPT